MYNFSELIERADGFAAMPQQEKVKTIAFFYCMINNTEVFMALRIVF